MINPEPTSFLMVKKKNETTSSKTRTRKGCPLSSLLFKIVFEVSGTAIREEEEIKGIPKRKEEAKLPLFADDMIHRES